MATRIAHVNIRVADPKASIAFYEKLGLEVVGNLQLSPTYFLLYLASPIDKNLTLELTVMEEPPEGYSRSPGTGHIALAVGDLDALLERLAASGIRAETEPFHPSGRKDLRICFVVDPDNVRVELIEGSFPTPGDAIPAQLML